MGPDLASQQAGGKDKTSLLIGCWQCESVRGLHALIFHSSSLLSQDGSQFKYTVKPNAIRVFDGAQYADYQYETNGDELAAVYPDGSQIYCIRSDCDALVSAQYQSPGNSSGQNYSNGQNVEATPYYDSGSWETEGDRQYYDDSAGFGGGAYENPSSGYYEDYSE